MFFLLTIIIFLMGFPLLGLLIGALLPAMFYATHRFWAIVANVTGFVIYMFPFYLIANHLYGVGITLEVQEVWLPMLMIALVLVAVPFLLIEAILILLIRLRRQQTAHPLQA